MQFSDLAGFEAHGRMPVYRQLANSISGSILDGRWKPGECLPSTRELSGSLKIARATIIKAYNHLESQGLIEPAKGTLRKVSSRALLNVVGEPALWRSLDFEPFPQREDRQSDGELVAVQCDEMPLWGDLPSAQWLKIVSKVLREAARGFAFSAEAQKLRSSIADLFRRSKGIYCHPKQVFLYSNALEAVEQIVNLLYAQGGTVAVECPGHLKIREILSERGASVFDLKVTDRGAGIESLKHAKPFPGLVFTSARHQTPTATELGCQQKEQLIAWACKTGAYVIEDGSDSDGILAKRILNPVLAALDRSQVCLFLYDFRRTMGPLLDLACVVVPPPLECLFAASCRQSDNFMTVDRVALSNFIDNGQFETHLKKRRLAYSARRTSLVAALTQGLGQLINVPNNCGALRQVVRFSDGFESQSILRCADEAGLPVTSTKPFYSSHHVDHVEPPNEFLFAFALLSEAEIAPRVQVFCNLLRGSNDSSSLSWSRG